MEIKMVKFNLKKVMAFVFISGTLIVSCTYETKPEKEKKDAVNPNGSSELAITMREMMDFSQQLKSDIENKKSPGQYPESIRKILTAKETEGMISDREVFTGYANHYLSSLDSVYAEGDVVVHYNGMVTSCVSCHSSYCQGPIPTIKKLYINTGN